MRGRLLGDANFAVHLVLIAVGSTRAAAARQSRERPAVELGGRNRAALGAATEGDILLVEGPSGLYEGSGVGLGAVELAESLDAKPASDRASVRPMRGQPPPGGDLDVA